MPRVLVATSAQSAAVDRATIDAGVPSRALMQRAGAAAAAVISERFPEELDRGALVLAGPGNNGGDGWVIARALAAAGVDVSVFAPEGARSPDCIAERSLALPTVNALDVAPGGNAYGGQGIVVDALLGTGSSGAPRGGIVDALALLRYANSRRATIVAVDVPSGLDATTGKGEGVVPAELTITFGTVKRGHLLHRDACGAIVAVDIGLFASTERMPRLVDRDWVVRATPGIAAAAHKGTKKKIVIVGGGVGMGGAAILATRAAQRSGVGMVRTVVHSANVEALQRTAPAALTADWSQLWGDVGAMLNEWADALIIGPGLGRSDEARSLLLHLLETWRGPVLLDADAVTLFASDLSRLTDALDGRRALLTPHPGEMAALLGIPVDEVLERRFEIGDDVAARCGAAVLLKGVPTVVSDGERDPLVSAAGSPVLAAAGSGDVLSGIAGTLMAQTTDAMVAGAVGAWVHGRAAEIAASSAPSVRGVSLDDVVDALGIAWEVVPPLPRYPILAELPAIRA